MITWTASTSLMKTYQGKINFTAFFKISSSDEQYKHAQDVRLTFNLKTTDVFNNFRKSCLQYYKLDPCHFFYISWTVFRCFVEITEIKLELITDINMFPKILNLVVMNQTKYHNHASMTSGTLITME